MSQTRSVLPSVLLFSGLTLLAQSCALEQPDDPSPAPLAQQVGLDGGVRVTPTTDGGDGLADASGGTAVDPDPGDADAGPAVPAGPPRETVKLPDGGVIVLDGSCPDHELFGHDAVGCCRSGKCGLSNHTLNAPGVSHECQSYAELRTFDDGFDLPDKTCRTGP